MLLSFIQNLFGASGKTISYMTVKELQTIKQDILKNKNDFPLVVLPQDRAIVRSIKEETQRKNINNITRTQAYLDFYQETPELHWSFLAHMVSRNAGYQMTDLKGDSLPSLLEKEEAQNFFLFLEKANAYIFQDAYPQLLLYQQSLKEGRSLFHLLPAFGVSKAMNVFWKRFWEHGKSSEITLALIINEQCMLQKRLVSSLENGYLFEKLIFFLQDRLEFTTVFFPYKKNRWSKKPYTLAGTHISHFEDPGERIEIGKKLYGILFLKETIRESSADYAAAIPHTGSRSDYWPEYFSPKKNEKDKLYSPSLVEAWKNIDHEFTLSDWVDPKTVHHLDALLDLVTPANSDMTGRGRLLVKLAKELKTFGN